MTGRAWIDAHCHLADERLRERLPEVLRKARASAIMEFVQGGVGPDDWQRQSELQAQYPGQLHRCVGIHPWWVAAHSQPELEAALERLRELTPGAVALGELGLDHAPRFAEATYPLQLEAFHRQLVLARELRLPVVLHVVKAHEPALALLREESPLDGGLIHAFAGSLELAHRYLGLGLLLSVGTAATRPGYETFKRALRSLPLESLVIESDAPDPGGTNEPSNLLEIAAAVGALKGLAAEEVLDRSAANLRRVFRL